MAEVEPDRRSAVHAGPPDAAGDTGRRPLPGRRPLTPEAREDISRYLAEHRPQEQLAEIRAQLKSLHQALVTTFSLDDILLGLSAGAGGADPGGLLPR